MHWVNSCTIMKKEVLEKMLFNFEKEIDKMKYFHRLFPLNAQLRPGIFYHSGPQRVRFVLRERGVFRNENIS